LTLEEAKGKNLSLCIDCCREKGMLKPESEKEGAETIFDLSNE
jgi:hypothetical protein